MQYFQTPRLSIMSNTVHMRKIKVKGHSVQNRVKTSGQTDGGIWKPITLITFVSNAVGNWCLMWRYAAYRGATHQIVGGPWACSVLKAQSFDTKGVNGEMPKLPRGWKRRCGIFLLSQLCGREERCQLHSKVRGGTLAQIVFNKISMRRKTIWWHIFYCLWIGPSDTSYNNALNSTLEST